MTVRERAGLKDITRATKKEELEYRLQKLQAFQKVRASSAVQQEVAGERKEHVRKEDEKEKEKEQQQPQGVDSCHSGCSSYYSEEEEESSYSCSQSSYTPVAGPAVGQTAATVQTPPTKEVKAATQWQ